MPKPRLMMQGQKAQETYNIRIARVLDALMETMGATSRVEAVNRIVEERAGLIAERTKDKQELAAYTEEIHLLKREHSERALELSNVRLELIRMKEVHRDIDDLEHERDSYEDEADRARGEASTLRDSKRQVVRMGVGLVDSLAPLTRSLEVLVNALPPLQAQQRATTHDVGRMVDATEKMSKILLKKGDRNDG